jgi:hypothetical protein
VRVRSAARGVRGARLGDDRRRLDANNCSLSGHASREHEIPNGTNPEVLWICGAAI